MCFSAAGATRGSWRWRGSWGRANTRPRFQLNVSTFCGTSRVASVCQ
jgi:hypothetical protein